MRRAALLLALFLVVGLSVADHAFAFGEIFKIENSGTSYCGDFNVIKFNADNNTDFWIRLDSETLITLSFTPTFNPGTTAPLITQTYQTGKTKASIVGGQLFEDLSYVTFQGTVTFDKFGIAKSASGTFIENSLVEPGCFSAGKFKTTERLFP